MHFDQFQVTFQTPLLTAISALLQTRIVQELEASLRDELLLLGPQLQPSLDEGLVPVVPADIYGTPFLIDARAESTAFATDGFEVHLSLDAPNVAIDRRRLQIVLGTVLTPLLPKLIHDLQLVPSPFVHQLSFFGMQASAVGPEGEHLSVEVDLVR